MIVDANAPDGPDSSRNRHDRNLPVGYETPPGQRTSIASESLFQGQREVLIRHGDDLYRLRITRNGKLILQK
jgi:hemin uptake protein HemP